MKIIIILLITLSIFYTNAQTNVRDSLKQLLQKHKEDTSRVLLLSQLGYTYLESEPDTTMQLALMGLELSRKIGYLKGEAESLNRIANVYDEFGNYPKAMEILLEALKINEKINNLDGIQKNLSNLGLIYNAQGDFREALNYFFKAKVLANQLNNKNALSISVVNIGTNYFRLKIFDSARLYTQQAYDIAYQINYLLVIGGSLYHMGDIYSETGQNSLALEYYRLSIPYEKKSENYFRLCIAYLGMAKVFEKTGQSDSSLFYAKQLLAIARQKGFTSPLMNVTGFLSTYYKNKHNYDSAFFYLEEARKADTLRTLIYSDEKNIPNGKLYYYGRFMSWYNRFTPNDATFQQMKSSGAIRYFHNSPLENKLSIYDRLIRTLVVRETGEWDAINDMWQIYSGLFYGNILDSIIDVAKPYTFYKTFMATNYPLLNNEKTQLVKFANLCRSRQMFIKFKIEDAYQPALIAVKELISELKKEYHLQNK